MSEKKPNEPEKPEDRSSRYFDSTLEYVKVKPKSREEQEVKKSKKVW